MRRPHGALAWAELAAALLITALIVALNLRFSTQAGALWRDEVSTVQLATRPTYAAVLRSLSLDSAPALYPTLLRLWSSPWTGEQDARDRGEPRHAGVPHPVAEISPVCATAALARRRGQNDGNV